ncbi:receptor-like kinase TMK4 [Rhodamnia argentea]|uniref:non-specific serine/threonine protein kinase n=1 Tax=Rhodamnia argentea TaxID=178133 RepID=A0A8B8PGK8_9MYRT|nr:receptor-like kinase TMK4 [Rhodamnia argentea]
MGDMSTLHRSLPTVAALLLILLLSAAASGEDDSSAMSALRAAMSPAPSGWSSATAYCKWDGVKCDSSSRVTDIDLASRSLTGTLPADLSSLSGLKTLSLQKNAFSGPIPNLANLPSLQVIYLDSNNFTSVPDGAFAGLTSLQTLSLSNNFNLDPWAIPSELNQSTGLVTFYAGSANVMGTLPDFFGSFPSLQSLRLSYNNLTGALPPSFAGSGIQNLWLNNQAQGLSGTIDVLSSMPQLYQVWLHKNRFTGPIPDLSKCESLFDLQLRDNDFTGVVPANLMSLPSIKNVSLDNNKLQGPVPDNPNNIKFTYDGTNSFCNTAPGPCAPQVTTLLEIAGALGYPMTLAESWEGNDACQGWSFIICQGKNVTSVSFSKQHFSGTISPAFANLTSLRSLLLNDNDLTGSIPDSLATLPHLQVLDVSNNNLSGAVPVFPASVKLTSTGNPLLGKSSSGSGGTPGSDSTSGNSSSAAKGSVSAGLIVALVLASLVFLGVVLFVLYKFCYAKRKNTGFTKGESLEKGKEVVKINGMNGYGGVQSEMHSQSSGDLPVFDGGNVAISIDVLRQVTDDFSEGNVLGRGGFGVVYKGELHDGTRIAVKRMESLALGNKGLSEFQAELAVLTKVRHRHLVALLGYCINGNERLLVYEHMPQGTLAQHLFEWEEMGCSPLTWKQRVTIALDVARGVEYLHSLAQQSFIHRDLKPSNILLGDDMRAKVADFGLVKNAPDGKYSLETRLAGTFGYLAPEYAATGRVTTKVDIYAYGVVLMEILTGRKALDDSLPDESAHLVTWFRRVVINKENIPKVIDQTLNPDNDTLESICKVAELAGHCTTREPSQRPDMGHAVNVLGPLVEQWKPSCQEEEEHYGIDLHMSLPQALERWQSDEGTSSLFNSASFSQTQSSVPSKPACFADSFNSTDCR